MEDNINQIRPKLREKDRIHLVSCGEFEDLLPRSLIVKTVNSHFKNFLIINESDLGINLPTAKILEEIFKTKGLHEFKKAEFAKYKEMIEPIFESSLNGKYSWTLMFGDVSMVMLLSITTPLAYFALFE